MPTSMVETLVNAGAVVIVALVLLLIASGFVMFLREESKRRTQESIDSTARAAKAQEMDSQTNVSLDNERARMFNMLANLTKQNTDAFMSLRDITVEQNRVINASTQETAALRTSIEDTGKRMEKTVLDKAEQTQKDVQSALAQIEEVRQILDRHLPALGRKLDEALQLLKPVTEAPAAVPDSATANAALVQVFNTPPAPAPPAPAIAIAAPEKANADG